MAQPEGASLRIWTVDAARFPEIRCTLLATEGEGRSLSGLAATDFTVTEDGKPGGALKCELARPKNQRLAVVLAVDCSGSMSGGPLRAALKAVEDFISRLGPNDAYAITAFSDRVRTALDFTSDKTAAPTALGTIRARGNTVLFDAIGSAIGDVAAREADRKAVVVLTDGQDTASNSSASDVGALGRKENVAVYAVGLGHSVSEGALRSLADETGGACFLTNSPDDLIDIYRKVLQEIRTTYVLTYTSPNSQKEPPWRYVEVGLRYRGSEATATARYAVPAIGEGRAGAPGPVTNLAIAGVAVFLLLDVGLLVGLLRRRNRRRKGFLT
jgi:VWFA-related protein